MPALFNMYRVYTLLVIAVFMGSTSLGMNGSATIPGICSSELVGVFPIVIADEQNLPFQTRFPEYSSLLGRIEQDGTVNIIIGLDIGQAYKPERKLSNTQAMLSQRKLIQERQKELNQALTGTVYRVKREYHIIPYMALQVDKRALNKLVNLSIVTGVYEDRTHPVDLAQSVPLINADDLHDQGIQGNGWAVAIVDTGVDVTHYVYSDRIISEACYSYSSLDGMEKSLCPNGQDVQIGTGAADVKTSICGYGSLCYHGTHVTGIAAGSNGVAPQASIIAIQVFTRFNSPSICTQGAPCILAYDSDIIAGLERVYTLNSSVPNIAAVNLSLGGGEYSSTCDTEVPAMTTVVNNLTAAGIAVIAASGNESYSNAMGWPACISSVVSVGALSKTDADAVWSNISPQLDLLAPGVNILSSYPNNLTATLSGTSMATPHVTGAWALLRSIDLNASVSELLSILKDTGVIKSLRGYSQPRIDVLAAANYIRSLVPEMDIQYEETGESIADGDSTPAVEEGTDFGTANINDTAVSHWFQVWNTGTDDLELIGSPSVQITGTNSPDFAVNVQPGSLIHAGDFERFEVVFDPGEVGIRAALLTIANNNEDENPYTFAIQGTGASPEIDMTGNAISISVGDDTPSVDDYTDFGSTNIGRSVVSRSFYIHNYGGADLNLNGSPMVELMGADAGEFTVTTQPGNPVEPDGLASFTLEFSPNTSGIKTAVVSIANDDADENPYTFTIQGEGIRVPIFLDVPVDHALFDYIEALYAAGYTAGCSADPLMYCPDAIMDRAESAVFMLRGQFGADYSPDIPSGRLGDDWSPGEWAESWAEAMLTAGLSAGCSADPLMYCPWTQLTRQEASVFGLRMEYGMDYTPPEATGTLFADMTDPDFWSTAWAEQAYRDDLLPECSEESEPLQFCPEDLVDRGWGAYLIVTAKGLMGD